MSRRLLLLRHGKSDWDADYGDDHDRPLAARGVRDAGRIGRFLAAAGQAPDLAIHSTAVRAARTLELAVEHGRWECAVEATPDLYESNLETLLRVVRAVDPAVRTLMLVGHEPLWSTAAARLSGGAAIRMPTAAVACVRFEGAGWREIARDSGELAWLVVPKLLRDD